MNLWRRLLYSSFRRQCQLLQPDAVGRLETVARLSQPPRNRIVNHYHGGVVEWNDFRVAGCRMLGRVAVSRDMRFFRYEPVVMG